MTAERPNIVEIQHNTDALLDGFIPPSSHYCKQAARYAADLAEYALSLEAELLVVRERAERRRRDRGRDGQAPKGLGRVTVWNPWHDVAWVRRLRLALAFREWPWNVPDEVVQTVGTRRPPESVFRFFRRLHGIEPAVLVEQEKEPQ